MNELVRCPKWRTCEDLGTCIHGASVHQRRTTCIPSRSGVCPACEEASVELTVEEINKKLLEACKSLLALAEGHPYEASATIIKWTKQAIAAAEGKE